MNNARTVLSIIRLVLSIAMIVMLGIALVLFSEFALSYTSDIGLTIATLLLALVAFVNFVSSLALHDAIPKITETIVQPFIYVRGSYKTEREREARQGQLRDDQIALPGIWLQNIGPGHAIRGTISLLTGGGEVKLIEKGQKYSFDRITPGMTYMYPSRRCPMLGDELNKFKKPDTDSVDRIELKIEYYDIQDRKYRLAKDERIINLAEPTSGFVERTTQDDTRTGSQA